MRQGRCRDELRAAVQRDRVDPAGQLIRSDQVAGEPAKCGGGHGQAAFDRRRLRRDHGHGAIAIDSGDSAVVSMRARYQQAVAKGSCRVESDAVEQVDGGYVREWMGNPGRVDSDHAPRRLELQDEHVIHTKGGVPRHCGGNDCDVRLLAAGAGVTTRAAGIAIQGTGGLIHEKQLSAGRNHKPSIGARSSHVEDVRNRVRQRPEHRT
jgi:hypothetical protein